MSKKDWQERAEQFGAWIAAQVEWATPRIWDALKRFSAWVGKTSVWITLATLWAITQGVKHAVMWPSYRLGESGKHPYMIGMGWAFVLTSLIWSACICGYLWVSGTEIGNYWVTEPQGSEVQEPGEMSPACNEECIAKIRASRTQIKAIEENEVRYVLDRYNDEYVSSSTWRTRAQSCLDHWDVFEEAERRTLYPAELLAGKAFVEALGCKFIAATNGDGGIGPMQITNISNAHKKAAARALGLSVGELRYKENSPTGYLHNVILGAIVLSDYEHKMKSRGVGILAYNTGMGGATLGTMGARGFMRRANIKRPYEGRTISEFRGAIPDSLNGGARPRIYVDRILAGAVIVDRAKRGLPLVKLSDGELQLEDIPGWNPACDGDRLVAQPTCS